METLTPTNTLTTRPAPAPADAIGSILVRLGELSPRQVAVVLETQKDDPQPFGRLARRLWHVPQWALDAALTEQLERTRPAADFERDAPDAGLTHLLSRRQAWQFELVPLKREGTRAVFATSRARAARAKGYLRGEFGPEATLCLAEDAQLYHHLQALYPWDAMASAWRERLGVEL